MLLYLCIGLYLRRRVDTINAFDLVLDYDPTADSSRFILFKNKLTDYVGADLIGFYR